MPYLLVAKSAVRDVWVMHDFPGQPAYGRFIDADGRDVYDLIDNGHTSNLGFVPRYKHHNKGRRVGDLLWTTGGNEKLASRRFVDVLESIGASGYRTFDVEVVYRNGDPVGDFIGLAVEDADPTHDLFYSNGFQFWQFGATDRVVDALQAAGVTDLSITPAVPDPVRPGCWIAQPRTSKRHGSPDRDQP